MESSAHFLYRPFHTICTYEGVGYGAVGYVAGFWVLMECKTAPLQGSCESANQMKRQG